MVIINGQIYSDGDAPDFGSVELIELFHEHGENRYIFKDEDKDKLALIKHCGEWVSV